MTELFHNVLSSPRLIKRIDAANFNNYTSYNLYLIVMFNFTTDFKFMNIIFFKNYQVWHIFYLRTFWKTRWLLYEFPGGNQVDGLPPDHSHALRVMLYESPSYLKKMSGNLPSFSFPSSSPFSSSSPTSRMRLLDTLRKGAHRHYNLQLVTRRAGMWR